MGVLEEEGRGLDGVIVIVDRSDGGGGVQPPVFVALDFLSSRSPSQPTLSPFHAISLTIRRHSSTIIDLSRTTIDSPPSSSVNDSL
jgi:hypothetical protein